MDRRRAVRYPKIVNDKYLVDYVDPNADERWDQFVKAHPYGWITHLSVWKRVIEGSFSHIKGYYPVLLDPASEELKAALPVFQVKSWITGTKMVSIPWATIADPLVSSREEFDLLVNEVEALAKDLDAKHVEIRALHSASLLEEGQAGDCPYYIHHYLELQQDPEALLRSFHRSCVRQRIRKATESNLNFRVCERGEDLEIMYRQHVKNRKHNSLPPQPFNLFKKVWEELKPENMTSLLVAEMGEKPVASLMLFHFKNRMSAEIAHMDEQYHNVSPNIYLFWQAMKQAMRDGYEIFDFGRTSPTNSTLLTFKSRWGTSTKNICHFYFPEAMTRRLSEAYSARYKILQGICKYAPERLASTIGSFCYNHTG